MNTFEEPFDEKMADSNSDFRAEIDRMVDGELSNDRQRALLKRLEDSPSGWKDLALAYVEASAWKSHFANQTVNNPLENRMSRPDQTQRSSGSSQSLDQSAPAGTSAFLSSVRPADPQTATDADSNTTNPRQSSASSMFAAVAVLLVFGLGVWLGRTQIDDPVRRPQIADNSTSSEDLPENDSPQLMPEELTIVADQRPAASIPESVQVVYSDGQSDVLRVVDVPLAASVPLESPQQFDEFWDRRDSPIPAELRAELELSGHQIRESRDFWPAQLPDGRPVVIPVSQVHVANNPLAVP